MMLVSLHKWPSGRTFRKSTLAVSCVAVLIILVTYYNHSWLLLAPSGTAIDASTSTLSPHLQSQITFWRSFYHVILNNDPQCNKQPDVVVPRDLAIGFESDHEHVRPDIVWVEEPDLQRLRAAHQNFIDDIQSSAFELVYDRGSRGIVTTLAESQIPLLLIQLRMLRATGSLLPMQVFFAQSSPYLEHVCDKVLSPLDASCIYLADVFKAAHTGISIDRYQYKMFAVLFSSFDEVLLLDSDAWPASNPDHLFVNQPFADTGMVVWPDFWYASESPYYFSIAKIDPVPKLNVKPATESGQLMYAKSKHEKSIMLATYYNYYGPNYYYPLQSQGAPGQGDKETFPLAALAVNESFYWVHTPVEALGRTDSTGSFHGSAMAQHDPVIEFQRQQQSSASTSDATTTTTTSDTSSSSDTNTKPNTNTTAPDTNKPIPVFIHANFPKFDPRIVFSHTTGSPVRDSNGSPVRAWTTSADQAAEKFGYDVEQRFWEVTRQVVCVDLLDIAYVDTREAAGSVCRNVGAYLKDVFGLESK